MRLRLIEAEIQQQQQQKKLKPTDPDRTPYPTLVTK